MPPSCHGLQRNMRPADLKLPLKNPYFLRAAIVYSEQLGLYLQKPPGKNTLMMPWSGERVFWYMRIKKHIGYTIPCDAIENILLRNASI